MIMDDSDSPRSIEGDEHPGQWPEMRMYISGQREPSESESVCRSTNPATGETVGTYPDGTRVDAQRAIEAAAAAQPALGRLSRFERADLLQSAATAVEDEIPRLSRTLTTEQGKPLPEAVGEVEGVVGKLSAAAEDIRRDELPTLPSGDPNKHVYLRREPHGVYGVITPWNYPLSTAATYLAPGLAVGNCAVWVPPPETSVVALELAAVLGEALPEGVLNVVTGEGPTVGDELVVNETVDAIAFTGSSEVGELIAKRAGTKPTLLELGGNGPIVVLDDTDVNDAAERVAGGAFTNAGQICTASEHVIVHEDIVAEFTDRLVEIAEEVTVGDPMSDGTDMGPLNNPNVVEKVSQHVDDAIKSGATLHHGGERSAGNQTDLYYEPTVLGDVTPEMAVSHEESFGPIAPIETVSSYDEAIKRANADDFGLSVGVFTQDVGTMYRFVAELEAGAVNVNDASSNWEPHTPVGGYTGKRSGTGRYGGRFTIEEMSQIKTVSVDYGTGTRSRE